MFSQTTVCALDDAQKFINCLFDADDVIEFRCIQNNRRPKCKWLTASDAHPYFEQLQKDNAAGYNIYIGANPRSGFNKNGDDSIELARSVFVDFDGLGDDCEAIAAQRIQDAGLPVPTMTIRSGHGIHCYWVLSEPVEDMGLWPWMQKALIDALGSDPVIKNPERIMRLPGFLNTKKQPHVPAAIVDLDTSRIYPAESIEAVLGQSEPVTDEPETMDKKDVDLSLTSSIKATVPVKKDTRRTCLFKLARLLKSKHKTANPKWFFPLLDEWLEIAKPNINHADKGLNRTQFVIAFNNVRYLIGEEPLARIYNDSKSVDLPADKLNDLNMYDEPKLITLACFCRALQAEAPHKPFFLKQDAIAQLMDIAQQRISDLLMVLQGEGIVNVVADYVRPNGTVRGRSKTYICLI